VDLAPELVDISPQRQSVSLTDPATHVGYLDSFAKLDGDRLRLSEIVDRLVAKSKRVADSNESNAPAANVKHSYVMTMPAMKAIPAAVMPKLPCSPKAAVRFFLILSR
jgi:DNA repair ATPase RecN